MPIVRRFGDLTLTDYKGFYEIYVPFVPSAEALNGYWPQGR